MHIQKFCEMFQYLLTTYTSDIIAGDFNYDLLKVAQKNCLEIFTDHFQMVNKPTYIGILDRSCLYKF